MSLRTQYRRRAAAGLTQPVFRYPFDETFFQTWTDDLAWLVGIIWSDGCLFSNTVEVCSKDKDLIETIARIIRQPNGVRPKNKGSAWRICFTARSAKEFLVSLGLTPAKSHTICWPEIPRKYQSAFVRGLIDGDGSVLFRKMRKGQQVPDLTVAVYGASPLLRIGLSNWLDSHGLKHYNGMSHHTVWKIQVCSQPNLRRLYRLLYPSSNVCHLKRKKGNYDAWMSTKRAGPGRPLSSPACRFR